jgi:hypothetical protein
MMVFSQERVPRRYKPLSIKCGQLFNITDEGELDVYLGVKISRPTSETIELKQPHLIQQILDDMGMKPNTKTKDKAAPSSIILCRDLDGVPFGEKWDYRSVIGRQA